MVWVAWDTYASGSYHIVLRPVRNGRVGELLPVTVSARFHANASVATDDKDRVWVAYDETEENWGKDTRFLLGADGPGLLRSRKIRFAVWATSRWLEPRSDLNQALDFSVIQSAQLIADKNEHMWVLFLPRTYASIRVTRLAFQGRWELLASYYFTDHWSSLLTISESAGRDDAPFALVADASGKIWVAGVTDHRVANYLMQDSKSDVVVASSPAAPLGHPMDLGSRGTEAPARSAGEPREREQLAQIRAYTVHIAQKELQDLSRGHAPTYRNLRRRSRRRQLLRCLSICT
jgi:hypothetical protein